MLVNQNPFQTDTAHDKEIGTVRTTSPAKLQPAKRDQLLAGRSNRFGFRQNVVRPTSGITPKFNEYDNVNNNVDKSRRAKSATVANQLRSSPQSSLKPDISSVNTEHSEQKITKPNANIR